MKKIFLLTIPLFLWAGTAKAVCPVCTVAVSAGVGLCRWLGIDDLISGAWIGALSVSIIIWIMDWLKRKNISFKFPGFTVTLLVYLSVFLPFYFLGIMGHPLNTFWGIDRLLFGAIAGSLAFLFGVWLHNYLKKKNNDKSFFPYQKIAVPIVLMLANILFFRLLNGQQY